MTTVHPRVCGELHRIAGTDSNRHGSSPRVWGTLSQGLGAALSVRFIPACVGNSAEPPQRRPTPPVHPRVCGELSQCAAWQTGIDGSSPRVWGTPEPVRKEPIMKRFIPACVGNSIRTAFIISPLTVHPRVCGELLIRASKASVAAGSSPRVWGTPASRGNDGPCCPVHPRVCGELIS